MLSIDLLTVFNQHRFAVNSKVFQSVIRDLLYIDDCDLVIHTVDDMQIPVNHISASCKFIPSKRDFNVGKMAYLDI
ncbi:Hypothetical predicted protein [Octopus vulgaris]|uniref:Uncharacterized protein n=1 Tax=Octopus vulgaris TaxID=6645 RepID=A0AA36BD25_OCTVU|nr:Hypothetical predicted protein [Octopus vulgaris]